MTNEQFRPDVALNVGRVAARLAGELWGGSWTYVTPNGTSVVSESDDQKNGGSKPEER